MIKCERGIPFLQEITGLQEEKKGWDYFTGIHKETRMDVLSQKDREKEKKYFYIYFNKSQRLTINLTMFSFAVFNKNLLSCDTRLIQTAPLSI